MEIEQIIVQFEAYLLTEKRIAKNSFKAYKSDISQFVVFLQNNKISFEGCTLQQLKEFIHLLHKNGISARAIARKISALKLLYLFLYRRFSINNIAIELVSPKLEKKLPRYLTEEEVERLLHISDLDTSIQGVRNSMIVYLLYVSGMRISELIGLTVSDIQCDTGIITVQGKGGKQRIVPIPDIILDRIKSYIQKVQNTTKNSGVHKEFFYLFPVLYGKKIKPISRQAFWVILKKICVKAGITRNISPHQLRHSLATHMLKNGMDLRSLQLLLGHENLSTVEIYTHVETTHLRNVYDKKHPRS